MPNIFDYLLGMTRLKRFLVSIGARVVIEYSILRRIMSVVLDVTVSHIPPHVLMNFQASSRSSTAAAAHRLACICKSLADSTDQRVFLVKALSAAAEPQVWLAPPSQTAATYSDERGKRVKSSPSRVLIPP